MSGFSRCTICNAVSDPEIALVSTEYKRQRFHTDPLSPEDMLCHDCYAEVVDINEEWACEDDLEDEE